MNCSDGVVVLKYNVGLSEWVVMGGWMWKVGKNESEIE